MVDIHTHILPDIDDGPKKEEESLRLCRMAVHNDIHEIVVTPHIYKLDQIDEFIQEVKNKLESLQEAVMQNEIGVQLYQGAEVFISDDIFYTSHLPKLSIHNSRYILVEFAYSGLGINRIIKYIKEIQEQGLIPIIAHPERYEYFQKDYQMVNAVAEQGALFQINVASYAGLTGRKEKMLANAMVQHQLADFMASDAHSVTSRPNNIREMLSGHNDIAANQVEWLLEQAPGIVLANQEFPARDRGVLKGNVRQFFAQRF